MQSDTAFIRAVVALFDDLGLDSSAVEHLEQFEEWLTTACLSNKGYNR